MEESGVTRAEAQIIINELRSAGNVINDYENEFNNIMNITMNTISENMSMSKMSQNMGKTYFFKLWWNTGITVISAVAVIC